MGRNSRRGNEREKGRKDTLAPQQVGNMILSGAGGETLQDRGSRMSATSASLNPYFSNNSIYRWQEYTRWYKTSWEARKLVDIPVDDALRKPFEFQGLTTSDERELRDVWDEEFAASKQIRRALIQERLLGGAVLLPIFLREDGEGMDTPLRLRTIEQGDLKAINVVDVSRLARSSQDQDPFSPDYDRINGLLVNGMEVHRSRMCILDGDALFSWNTQRMMENYRYNPRGFGESKLAPVYDLLVRVTGTQQAAFHLVNMASCLLVKVENLRSVIAADSPARQKMEEIIEQISIYRGAMIDAKGADIHQHSSTFGSVPELVMTFAQLLSAASDIPATRFLGQAPGGLNATGESDTRNYYDMLKAYQRTTCLPIHRRSADWIGSSIWGWDAWAKKSKDLEIIYPPLHELNDQEQMEIDRGYAEMMRGMYTDQLITRESAVREIVERNIFATPGEAEDFVETEPAMASDEDIFGAVPGGDLPRAGEV